MPRDTPRVTCFPHVCVCVFTGVPCGIKGDGLFLFGAFFAHREGEAADRGEGACWPYRRPCHDDAAVLCVQEVREFLRSENEFVRSRQAELARAREQWRLQYQAAAGGDRSRREKKASERMI